MKQMNTSNKIINDIFLVGDKVSLRRDAGIPNEIVDSFGVGVVVNPPEKFKNDHWSDSLNRLVVWIMWQNQEDPKWSYADELSKE